MTEKELFYPSAAIRIGEYVFDRGISWTVCSDTRELTDWGKLTFTREFRDNLSIQKGDAVAVYQGYGTQLQQTFLGQVVKAYNNAGGEDEILFKDKAYLMEKTVINHTFLQATPQELIRYGLSAAGVTEYRLAETAYQPKARVPFLQQALPAVLKRIDTLWGLKDVYRGFIKGIFYWGLQPEAAIIDVVS